MKKFNLLLNLQGVLLFTLLSINSSASAQINLLTTFSSSNNDQPPASWRTIGIPKGKVPLAQFDVVSLDGGKVLRLATDKSYGTVAHEIKNFTPTASAILKWRWRLDEPMINANLRVKSGDDVAIKVCVMYDMPTDEISFSERALLGLARSISGERLPSATLCYIWDTSLPTGAIVDNAYTKRVKFMVLEGKGNEKDLKIWKSIERNVAQDFLQAFGHESKTVPQIVAIVVGADSDNTSGSSLAYVGDVSLTP